MASLTKDAKGRSPYWTCCYVAADGRRLKKSCKVRIKPEKGERRADGELATAADKRKEALEACLAIERAENLAKHGSLTEQALKRILSETLERTTGRGLRMVSCDAWLREWLEEKRRTRSGGTAERYAYVVDGFLASLDKRATLPLEAITTADVLRYRDGLLAEGKAHATVKLNVVSLSGAFHTARRRQLLAFNPCEPIEHPANESAKRECFTPEQVRALVEAAEGDDWRGAILTGFYTGARLGDIAALRWENLDLENRAVRFTPQKSKRHAKVVVVPLHPELEQELLKRPGVGKAPVFPSLIGRRSGLLGAEFARIMMRAGIRPTGTRSGTRLVFELSFHSLRHAFVSALANAGVSAELRQALAGHASAAIHEGYTHRALDPLRAAVGLLPSIVGAEPPATAGDKGNA